MKKEGTISPPLNPGAQGYGSKEELQQESLRPGLALNGLLNHRHPGTQVVSGAHRQGQQDYEPTASSGPQVWVGEVFPV